MECTRHVRITIDLEARDLRDTQRSVSPLKPAEGALLLDNSALSIEASVAAVLEAWEERRPFDRPQVEMPQ
jgi:3-phosphoshikimate 1-carboxyvinyltransferase